MNRCIETPLKFPNNNMCTNIAITVVFVYDIRMLFLHSS